MRAYILRRLMLVVPTLFGIMVVNVVIIQAAPGGPVEQMLAQIQGTSIDATERFSGSSSGGETLNKSATDSSGGGAYRGARGLPKELIQRIEKNPSGLRGVSRAPAKRQTADLCARLRAAALFRVGVPVGLRSGRCTEMRGYGDTARR